MRLSEKASEMLRILHREAHAHGRCTCPMQAGDHDDTENHAIDRFGPELIEAAANDDVAAILVLRDWFELLPLV